MNTDSGFLNDVEEELGSVAAGAAAIELAKKLGVKVKLPKIFGKGNQGAKRRGQKRQALAKIGFTYEDVKGKQARHFTNIENFNDQALDNMAKAVEKYGTIVTILHNKGLFNENNAQNYALVEQIIQSNGGGAKKSTGNSTVAANTNNPISNIKTAGFSKIGLGILLLSGLSYGAYSLLKEN